MKTCPFCAEEIQDAAIVCKHCRRDLATSVTPAAPPTNLSPYEQQQAKRQNRRREAKLAVLTIGGTLVALIILAIISSTPPSTRTPSRNDIVSRSTERPRPVTGVTYSNYQRLTEGMTYEEVVRILGSSGKEISRSDVAGYTTVMYSWESSGFANMNAMFQNGKLITKAQLGLR